MMDQTDLGKVIFINGPSFGGKTHFINILLKSFNNDVKFSVINFESVYEKNVDYTELKKRFIEAIESKRKKYDIVFAESTIINYGINNLTILLSPTYEVHTKRFIEYKKEYGEFDSNRRIYFPTIASARNHFNKIYNNYCKNYIVIVDDFNNEQIEEIKKYVFSS